ncbi:type II secretion system protein [Lentisphaera marina]|uniref:type II secretion system protein n=1 Tax=Lentisphaera marina TaxID=1111041 RepID=UPI0023654DB0|nr:type II secretion system protein [Lentisphaera marina]MDD7986600.1 type II secretion system protein [Lentisphaera marina]
MKKFTLIEVLVVVAIIGILASMLLPVLSKGRAKARQAVCTSNLKQMYYATYSYTTDNDGAYPATRFPNVGIYSRSLHDGIAQYIMTTISTDHNPALQDSYDNGGVFTCPSFDESELAGRGVGATASRVGYSGYGTNVHIQNNLENGQGEERRISDLNGNMIAHTEGQSEGVFNLNIYPNTYGVYPWHDKNSTGNYLYLGGHIQPSKINHLLTWLSEPWLVN